LEAFFAVGKVAEYLQKVLVEEGAPDQSNIGEGLGNMEKVVDKNISCVYLGGSKEVRDEEEVGREMAKNCVLEVEDKAYNDAVDNNLDNVRLRLVVVDDNSVEMVPHKDLHVYNFLGDSPVYKILVCKIPYNCLICS
jgi:RNA 3'-terminal phosphate cyclase